jgi:hypothetical protein
MISFAVLAAWILMGVAIAIRSGEPDRAAALPMAVILGPLWAIVAVEQATPPPPTRQHTQEVTR